MVYSFVSTVIFANIAYCTKGMQMPHTDDYENFCRTFKKDPLNNPTKKITTKTKKSIIFTALALSVLLFSSSLIIVFSSLLFSTNSSAYATSNQILEGRPVPLGSQVPRGLAATTINSGAAPSADNFNISSGYKIEPVLWNLTFPSAVV